MPDQHPGSHGTWSCRCCNIREKEHFASGGSIHRQWHAPGCRQGQGTRKPGGLRRTPSNLEVKTHLDKSLTSQSFLQKVLVTWLDSGQHHYNGYCALNAREVSLNGAGALPFFLPAGMRRPWLGQGCHLGFMSDDLTTSWTWRHNIFTYSRFFSFKICGRGGIYISRVNLGTEDSSRWIPQRNTLCHFEEKPCSPMFSWLLMGLYCLQASPRDVCVLP